jgi:hypothetical protein
MSRFGQGENEMSNAKRVCLGLLLLMSVVVTPVAVGAQDFHPFKGSYALYSRELGDTGAPTRHDAKLALLLTGPLAKELFTRLGAVSANRPVCGSNDVVERAHGALSCTRDTKTGEVDCALGFDILKGEAIAGSIC